MFDFSKVEESNDYDLLPEGTYSVVAEKAEWKSSQSGGEYLNVQFKVFSESYKGRVLFHIFNLINSNNTAVNIAMQQMLSFVSANGKKKEDLTRVSKDALASMILDMTADVYVKIQKGQNGYPDQNRIVNFKATKSKQADLFNEDDEIPF